MAQSSTFTKNPQAADSRRSPRRSFNRAVGLLRDGRYEMGQALQISEGGLSFVVPSLLLKGERLIVTLVIPGGGTLVLRASVITERPKIGRMYSYGIEFRSLDLHQRRMIRSYVSAKTEAEAESDHEIE